MKKTLTITLTSSAGGHDVVTEINGLRVVTLGDDAHNLVNLTDKINELIIDVDRIRGELSSIHAALANTLMKFVPLETENEPSSVL
jgi:hypothetical protein